MELKKLLLLSLCLLLLQEVMSECVYRLYSGNQDLKQKILVVLEKGDRSILLAHEESKELAKNLDSRFGLLALYKIIKLVNIVSCFLAALLGYWEGIRMLCKTINSRVAEHNLSSLYEKQKVCDRV